MKSEHDGEQLTKQHRSKILTSPSVDSPHRIIGRSRNERGSSYRLGGLQDSDITSSRLSRVAAERTCGAKGGGRSSAARGDDHKVW